MEIYNDPRIESIERRITECFAQLKEFRKESDDNPENQSIYSRELEISEVLFKLSKEKMRILKSNKGI